jgi:hypothetical protein
MILINEIGCILHKKTEFVLSTILAAGNLGRNRISMVVADLSELAQSHETEF